ncbi:LOW QUALITY PROTEIN: DUF4283 domain-containing protein, partial [Cephalotus follicularis]
ILMSRKEKKRICAQWSHCLIVKVFGKTIVYHFFLSKIQNLWPLKGNISLVDMGMDFFLVKFIRHWEPEFRTSIAMVPTTTIWVRLVKLPIKFFSSIQTKIGNHLGTLLRIDNHTIQGARGRYARLCVQIDITKPLVTRIRIGRCIQYVQYESILL